MQVNTVVGTIAAEGEAAGAPAAALAPAKEEASLRAPAPAKVTPKTGAGTVSTEGPAMQPAPVAKAKVREAATEKRETVLEFPNVTEPQQGERIRSSPLVRRIARENNVELNRVAGTGLGGRITKEDILQFIEHRPAPGQQPAAAASAGAPAPAAQIGQRRPFGSADRWK